MDFKKYIKVVNSIVDGYFDDNNQYVPHAGRLIEMCEYYNNYYPDGIENPVDDLDEMLKIVENTEFIDSFNLAIECHSKHEPFGFAYAHDDALDIIEYRKNSFYAVESMINRLLNTVTKQIGGIMSHKNFDQFVKMASEISSGNLSADSIVEAVHNSTFFKKNIAGESLNESHGYDNVTDVEFGKK